MGVPSTYATIVETVLSESRGYAKLDEKKFIVPTDKGMELAAFADKNFSSIINLNYTRDMEKDLDKIAEGKMTKLEFLTNFYNNLESTIKNNPDLAKAGSAQMTNEVCPKCGKPLVIRRGKYGLFKSCSGWPHCTFTKKMNS